MKNNPQVDARIPKRLTRGPIDGSHVNEVMTERQKKWYTKQEIQLSGTMKFEIHNFMDGKTNITEIRDHITAEFYPVPLALIQHYVEDLVKLKLVTF